jgi:hypothetical protein
VAQLNVPLCWLPLVPKSTLGMAGEGALFAFTQADVRRAVASTLGLMGVPN